MENRLEVADVFRAVGDDFLALGSRTFPRAEEGFR